MESDFKSEDVCRVCLSSGEEMQQLFVKESSLVEQIEYCTGLLLSPAPSLPTLICQPCLSHLRTAHSFKTTCLASHKSLHAHISTEDTKQSKKQKFPMVTSCMIPISPITVKVEMEDQDDLDLGSDMDEGMGKDSDDEWLDQVRKSKRVKMKKEKEESPDTKPARPLKRGPYKKRARPPAPREPRDPGAAPAPRQAARHVTPPAAAARTKTLPMTDFIPKYKGNLKCFSVVDVKKLLNVCGDISNVDDRPK